MPLVRAIAGATFCFINLLSTVPATTTNIVFEIVVAKRNRVLAIDEAFYVQQWHTYMSFQGTGN